MNTGRLIEIIRARRETGAYGDTFLMMSRATMAGLIDSSPAPAHPWMMPWLSDRLDELLTIPVVVDAKLPLGAWRLLHRDGTEVDSHGLTARDALVAERDEAVAGLKAAHCGAGYQRAAEELRDVRDTQRNWLWFELGETALTKVADFLEGLAKACGAVTTVERGAPVTHNRPPWPIGVAPKGAIATHTRNVTVCSDGSEHRTPWKAIEDD